MNQRPTVQVKIAYELVTTSSLHVGSGRGRAGLHREIVRDARGYPFIPGSSFKGRLRDAAGKLCQHLNLKAWPDDRDLGRRIAGMAPLNGPEGVRYIPDRIFGSAWQRCTLHFSDARFHERNVDRPEELLGDHGIEPGLLWKEIRSGAARSRQLGISSAGRLFFSEVAPAGMTLSGTIEGPLAYSTLEGISDLPIEPVLLWLSLLLVGTGAMGGSKSAGAGAVAWKHLPCLLLDDIPLAPDNPDLVQVMELCPDFPPEVIAI